MIDGIQNLELGQLVLVPCWLLSAIARLGMRPVGQLLAMQADMRWTYLARGFLYW
jgi:hypothetical protein